MKGERGWSGRRRKKCRSYRKSTCHLLEPLHSFANGAVHSLDSQYHGVIAIPFVFVDDDGLACVIAVVVFFRV